MSSTPTHNPERLEELMIDAATQGLAPQDAAELSAALDRDPALRFEAEAYELAVTAVDLALSKQDTSEALPDGLRAKLIAAVPSSTTPRLSLAGTAKDPAAKPAFSWTDGRAFGWYAAAAAIVALCVVLIQPPQTTTTGPDTAGKTPDPAPTPDEQYQALANEADTITASWAFNADPEGGADPQYANATGEVIWNGDSQTGYMKLKGLPVNDPNQSQYQLWIVDASRDPAVENTNRIDGGVFDITAEGEVIVPINAKLIARNAAAFAITVETPGGVVESKGPLQVLAVVEAS